MKKMVILIGLLVLSVLVVGCTQGTLAGEATKISTAKVSCDDVKKCNAGPACVWVDMYAIYPELGTSGIQHTPLSRACDTVGLRGYAPVAYELRRDFSIFSDSTCDIESRTQLTSDHQILKSYGATEVNFGEEVGNIPDLCSPSESGTTYTILNQMYDGALCCRT